MVSQLDGLAQTHTSPPLYVIVLFVGPERDPLVEMADQFHEQNPTRRSLITIPRRHDIGDRQLRLNAEAETTVLIVKERKVVHNHALREGELTEEKTREIVSQVREQFQ